MDKITEFRIEEIFSLEHESSIVIVFKK